MNQNELDLILQDGEGYKIEFKENASSDLAKEFVAFANSSGGRIFIGINDRNEIIGTDISNSAISKVYDIASACDPSIYIEIDKVNTILVISVKEGPNKPYRSSKGFYIRNGANSQKMTTSEITEFIRSEGKVRFDEIWRDDINVASVFSRHLLDGFFKLARILT